MTPTSQQGQKLNQVERWKAARHPLEVKQAVLDRYALEGPASIAERRGGDGATEVGRALPAAAGGRCLHAAGEDPRWAADRVAGAAHRRDRRRARPRSGAASFWGDGYLDLTTRQDIQLHWIKIGAVPEIWRRLEAVGITTVQACGDSARNVLCCPVSGIDGEEVIDAYPIAVAISDFFTGNREYANLPRKFKMSVTGCREDCAQAEINDLALVPARLDDGTVGFNLLVGGGLSDGPRLASDVDVFVHPNDAVEISRAVAQLFDELGNRENRWTCRLRYLVQELGPETFRAELAARARIPLTPAGEHLTNRYRGDHIGVHAQRQEGLSYVGVNVTVGRMTGTNLVEMARLAETFGDGEIRLTTDQNLILTGVPEEKIAGLLAEPLLQTHSPNPKPFERGAVACTGNEFCRLAIVETKARALQWAQELDRRVSSTGADIIRLHFSGCSASCAQPQIADVGFRGETAKTADAIVEGVDIGLGGSLGRDAAFIDWVEGAKPVTEVPDAMVRLFDRYAGERREGERFYEWARRMPNDGLRTTLRQQCRRWYELRLRYPRRDERYRRGAGQSLVLGAGAGGDRRRSLRAVRRLHRGLSVRLTRHRRRQSAEAGEDVHRLLPLLGFLPARWAAL